MNKNFIVIGDSITYGIGDFETLGWATMLKRDIVNRDGTDMCKNFVHVVGFPGATSKDILDKIDDIYRVYRYNGFDDVVILSIGINDVYEYEASGENSVEEYISNIICITDYISKQGVGLILLGLMPVNDEDYINDSIIEYDNALEKFAKDNEIDYIPMFDVLKPEDLIDGLHPTKEGHEKIYNRVIDYLEE